MRFDFYGRFELHVAREGDLWKVWREVNGIRRIVHDIFIPSIVREDEIERYLDDLLHEFARTGESIRRLN